MRAAFLRTVLDSLRRRARAQGVAGGRSGAVVFMQRFGGALNLNVHFHALVLDGVFEAGAPDGSVVSAAPDAVDRPPEFRRARPLRAGELDGRLAHELRHPYSDGTTSVVFEPLTFLEKLAALVPPPRAHLVTYHGALAPASSLRAPIVPRAPASGPGARTKRRLREGCGSARRDVWADLLKRVFAMDALPCETCGGRRVILAAITRGPRGGPDPRRVGAAVIPAGAPSGAWAAGAGVVRGARGGRDRARRHVRGT